ncbi:hypothetical protein KO525_10450 [Psychrosphaera sp. B3R10]|uniref:PsiF repeat-containing protein n=1 Tax=Psychrosphaera algicola TaxID=3023714 RepID=A0ABT5FAP4_9GAMM|nr:MULTISPECIES: hypothetical protein [unclassified Psychrosphaera]MBU2883620.1 hypothetical protein [Psychrosphaera sp. I2R16]MBU2989798.1 hypothetical protein [Psychrosphaera sp. B3R10]MDC2888600.1 hypothetical protein [Psychrosphaera sp. G1-22]MDO6719757.1 hypothetical protein [Psychrosphaera sp. 1_MG-2023]
MKTLKLVFISLMVVTAVGCKSTADKATTSKEVAQNMTQEEKLKQAKADIKCRSEAPTGSRISKMKCTTKKQRQARSRTKTVLDEVLQNQVGALKGPVGGGN